MTAPGKSSPDSHPRLEELKREIGMEAELVRAFAEQLLEAIEDWGGEVGQLNRAPRLTLAELTPLYTVLGAARHLARALDQHLDTSSAALGDLAALLGEKTPTLPANQS